MKTNEEGLANYSMPFTPGNYSVEAYVDGEYMEFSTARLDNIVINNNVNSVVSFVPEILTFDYLGSGKIGLYLSGCTVKHFSLNIDITNIDTNNYGSYYVKYTITNAQVAHPIVLYRTVIVR